MPGTTASGKAKLGKKSPGSGRSSEDQKRNPPNIGPALLTPVVKRKFLCGIRNGLPENKSWEYAGIAEHTGYRWTRIGRTLFNEGVGPDEKHPQQALIKLYVDMIKAKGNLNKKLYVILTKNVFKTQDFDKAFALLKHLEGRENCQKATQEAMGGMGGYTPPQVGE